MRSSIKTGWILGGMLLLAVAGAMTAVRAADETETPAPRRYNGYDRRTNDAVQLGLKYLAGTQTPEGAWEDKVGYKVNYEMYGVRAPHVAATALAALAMMASGSVPGEGEYGVNVEKALVWMLDHVTSTGYITEWEQKEYSSRMYGHAFATLFLAEAYGTAGVGKNSKDLAERLERGVRAAVDCIVKSQKKDGGWRYTPGALDDDSDISVTVSTIMALRAARNAGIAVPKKTVEEAIDYVKACYSERGGSFEYQYLPQGYSRTSYALTAAGVAALQGAGDYYAKEIHGGIRYLAANWDEISVRPGGGSHVNSTRFHYFYAHYYAVQAFYQYGGEEWRNYWEAMRDEMLALQTSDNSWNDFCGPNYATAMACLVLQIPNGYLPIVQK